MEIPSKEGTAKKPSRVLACTACQSRKIKCDRNFPCSHCVQSQSKCIQASYNPRQRKRRFAERDLLDRLRRYEDLLHRHNVAFEPMHPEASSNASPHDDDESIQDRESAKPESSEQSHGPAAVSEPRTAYEADDIYKIWGIKASKQPHTAAEEYEREHDTLVKRAWDQLYQQQSNSHLIFGLGTKNTDLSALHPKPAHMMKLFQTFLDNVNSILKVVHTPSLQPRFIDATVSSASTTREMEALMFSIYCAAVYSMDETDCLNTFEMSRQMLLPNYQFACQESLLNCGFLRTSDRECLTALHLYLISFDTITDPRSLSAFDGVAVRIAQRIGIHDETANSKCTPFEAEMRRRLWWSLIMFDNRVAELSNNKAAMLGPAWDCKPPANVSDYDLRPEMKEAPSEDSKPTEALFAVVRSLLMDFIRHSQFHLDFTRVSGGQGRAFVSSRANTTLGPFEQMLEDGYFKQCLEDNPLHFMAVNMIRGYLAKCRLLEQRSKEVKGIARRTTANREILISYAVQMLECDTRLMISPLTKGYVWLVQDYFPFPGYMNIVQELQRHPLDKHADKMWQAMSDNYQARRIRLHQANNLFLKYLGKTILQAWEATKVATKEQRKALEVPQIVLDIKQNLAELNDDATTSDRKPLGDDLSTLQDHMGSDGLNAQSAPYLTPTSDFGLAGYEDMFGQTMTGFDLNQMDWNTIFGE